MKPFSTVGAMTLATLAVLCAPAASAQSLYAYKLPGQSSSCHPSAGINDSGQIAGSQAGTVEIFISDPNGGQVRILNQPGDLSVYAFDINNAGIVVGQFSTRHVSEQPFITDANGANRHLLATPPGMSNINIRRINDQGQMLGHRDWPWSVPVFVEADGLTWHDVETPADAVNQWVGAFNESGQVLGGAQPVQAGTTYPSFAFVTGPDGRGATWLSGPDQHREMRGADINDSGQVAGELTRRKGKSRSFVTDPGPANGHFLLGTPTGRFDVVDVNGVDAQGRVHGEIGEHLPDGSIVRYGFVTAPGGRTVINVNHLIANLPPDVEILGITDINRRGQMAAYGKEVAGYSNSCYIICNHPDCTPD